MKIHFLQTEWSDIIILQAGNHFAFVDTGFEEQFPLIQNYLNALGAEQIDFILNTHFHRDHYGSIPLLVKNFKVDKVFLKEYSGLDCTTAWGTVANDEYRISETNKYLQIKNIIQKFSSLIPVESINEIDFCKTALKLFNNQNTVKKIYEDSKYPDFYHKIRFSENTNSLSVYFEFNGKNVFLGGDMMDHESEHPLADKMLLKIAKQINKPIHIYKVPHHATNSTGLPETLEIFKPETAIITNSREYTEKQSPAPADLRNSNPEIQLLFTKDKTIVIDI